MSDQRRQGGGGAGGSRGGHRGPRQKSRTAPSARSRQGDLPRSTALRVLRAVSHEGAYANLELPKALRRARLSGRDAGFATELTYGTLRMQGLYDAIIAEAAQRQARLDADADAAARRRELAMVESYATEADLRRAYGERIVLVEEAIKTSHMGVANLRTSLLSQLRQAGELELQGQPVGKPLRDRIRNQRADLQRQLAILDQQLGDQAALDGDLQAALSRYRELKQTAARD